MGEAKQKRSVVFCECVHAGVLSAQAKDHVRQALETCGLSCEILPDLCGLAARRDPFLGELAGAPALAVAACHPRAVRWLFSSAGAQLPDGVVQLDMRGTSPEELVRAVQALGRGDGTGDLLQNVTPPGAPRDGAARRKIEGEAGDRAWLPWFPVIDYDRCEDCHQCLGFCLFGVYGEVDGRVQVVNPDKCKTGCPACARVCPSAAIIFPKYVHAPINGGETREGDAAFEPVKIDKAALLSGDTLKILQDRGKRALLLSRDSNEVRALQERLTHLAGSGGVLPLSPRDLLASPPSEEPK